MNDFAPPFLWITAAAVAGAVAASVGGLVAERLPHQLGIAETPEPDFNIVSPPSRCDSCRRPLGAISIVPVIGFLLRRGRCPCGKEPVSRLYPIAEAITAALSALIVWTFGPTPAAAGLLVLLWVGLTLGWTDAIHHVLPEAITIPLFWAGLLLSPFAPDPYARILGSFVACAAMWGSFAFIGWRKKKNIFSGGDIVLAAAAGAWLGIDGVATYLLVAVVLFLAHAVPARLRGHAMTPFGPALSTALFACATASALGLRFL